MATTRISALTELTTPASADVLVINDDSAGSTKKIQLSNLIPDDAIDSEHYVAGSIDNEHLADDAVGIDELSATGTASSSTFLRGDNSWVTPTDTNTTYSVQDGELSEINFTSADHTKLNAIEASADVTDATNVTAAGALMDSELAGIAAVKATTGTFLTADQTKLDGIETSATADQTAGEILTLIEDGVDSVHYVDASIDNVHLADDAVGIEELSATGTASSSTFLRGDNSWVTPTDTNTVFDPDGAQVFNESGADVNFRVEGSGAQAALFVQGSDGNVGIRTSTPDARLHTYSTSGTTTNIAEFEAAIGSYTGTSLIASNSLGAASTYSLFKCVTDSDGDAGGPVTQFEVTGDGRGLSQFTAKAWCVWNLSTPGIIDSHNISGISDDGTGITTVSIDVNMANALYSVVGSVTNSSRGVVAMSDLAVDAVTTHTREAHTGDYTDYGSTSIVFFGD